MPIQTILDLSTGHLPKKDRDLLSRYQTPNSSKMALIAYPYEYGCTVSTSGMLDSAADRADRIDAMRREGFSEYFVAIMVKAAENGAVMVRFDADAEYEPDLACFEDNSDEPIPAGGPRP